MAQGNRRNGKPRTEAERRARHARRFGSGSKLPKRGTGRNKEDAWRFLESL